MSSVHRYIVRLAGNLTEADDLTHDTFLLAWCRRRSLKQSGAVRAWLLKIATNTFRDKLRRRAARPTVPLLAADAIPNSSNHILESEKQDESARAIIAMQSLPERRREVLALRACEDLSIAGISQVLRIERNAVKASVRRFEQQCGSGETRSRKTARNES